MPKLTPQRQALFQSVAKHRLSEVILVLENIHDPHNAAAIMRSAESLGIQHIWLIMEDVQEPWDPKIVGKKSSSHANKWLTFESFDTSQEALNRLKKEGYTLFGTMLDEYAESLDQIDFTIPPKIALIMGNEHVGLSPLMQACLDHKIYIPMYGFTQSFNVSVACALCLWEISHQRRKKGLTLSPTDQEKLFKYFEANQKDTPT